MDEREFLQQLQNRAKEQERAMHAVPFPKLFTFIAEWLSNHPWRFLIPLAFIISVLLRNIIGSAYTDKVLAFFRWL